MESTVSNIGFSHFIAQSDFLGKTILAILIGMSIVSWTLIIIKGIAGWRRKQYSNQFLHFFWNASSLDTVRHEIQTHGIRCPFSHLTSHAQHAQEHHVHYGAAKLSEAGTQQEFVIRTMRMVMDEDAARLENGLTVLATIGSTAPFIGLFGTVWGIYNALINISASGAGTLIMTGIGLAVAIPAVIGYNWLVRSNNVLMSKLDTFANELLTFLTTGKLYSINSEPTDMASPVVHNIKRG